LWLALSKKQKDDRADSTEQTASSRVLNVRAMVRRIHLQPLRALSGAQHGHEQRSFLMKRIQNGIAVGILAICVAGPAIGHGASTGTHATGPSTMSPTTSSPSTSATTPSGQPKAIGQPNQSCGSATAPNTPGNAASARGSAFNPTPGVAGTKYAGQQPQNSNSPVTNSQYDVACSHQPQ
jgi:hypothetical protein